MFLAQEGIGVMMGDECRLLGLEAWGQELLSERGPAVSPSAVLQGLISATEYVFWSTKALRWRFSVPTV